MSGYQNFYLPHVARAILNRDLWVTYLILYRLPDNLK